jgi:antibiotic biosynthesis monooxygenase (ABM) superfamily enzyme
MDAELALYSLANVLYVTSDERESLILTVEEAVEDNIKTSADGLAEWLRGTTEWSGWTISELADEWDSI